MRRRDKAFLQKPDVPTERGGSCGEARLLQLTWDLPGNLGPGVAEPVVQVLQQSILCLCPGGALEGGVKMVQIALSALLAHSPWHVRTDLFDSQHDERKTGPEQQGHR